nr:unnamed protein product [Fasciola hepatica]
MNHSSENDRLGFITIDVVMQGDTIIFRQGFEYSTSEWLETKRLSEESRISRKHQTRLRLELCLKRDQRELTSGSRLKLRSQVYLFWKLPQ